MNGYKDLMKHELVSLMHSAGVFAPFRRANRRKTLILMYHRFREDADRIGRDARQIDGHLERVVGFVDVDGWGAFAGEGVGPEHSAELEEDAPHLIGKIADFRRERDGVDPIAHASHHGTAATVTATSCR